MRKLLTAAALAALAVTVVACTGDDDDDGATVASVAVSPATASIGTAGTQQFTATATMSDASTQDVSATATWTSSSANIATISSTGLATANSAGTTTITATYSGLSGTATLTVTGGTTATFNGSVSGDWSGTHAGTNDYYVRIIDDADGSVVYCSSQSVAGVFSLSGTNVLQSGHTYHAEALVDLDGDGTANENPHKYVGAAQGPAQGNLTWTIPHGGAVASNWTDGASGTDPACP